MGTSPILFGNFADAGDSIITTLAGEQNEGIHEELDRKSNLAMRAPHLSDQLAVSRIEVEVASKLLLVRVARVATVTRTPLVRARTKDQALVCSKSPMRNRSIMR